MKKSKLKSKLTNKKSLILSISIATLIAITPFLFYLYQTVPNTKVLDTFLFTYTSSYYGRVDVLAWVLANKAISLLLLFIWFLTCNHWWRHVILIPIAMYVIQISTILNDDINYLDSNQIYYLVPIMLIMIPLVYLIRAQLIEKIKTINSTLEELENEFMHKPTTVLEKIKQYF